MFDGKKIEKARILMGMTRKELAGIVGIHPVTYQRVIKGETQNPPTIKAIADVLGLSMEDIYVDEQSAVA